MQVSMQYNGRCHIQFWQFTQGKDGEALNDDSDTYMATDRNEVKGNRKTLKGKGVTLKGNKVWRDEEASEWNEKTPYKLSSSLEITKVRLRITKGDEDVLIGDDEALNGDGEALKCDKKR